jgi:hypothetical protein
MIIDADTTSQLPVLPDFDKLVEDARAVLAHATQQRDSWQARVDLAQKYIDRLSGTPATRRASPGEARPKPVSEPTFRSIMNKLAAHRYATVETLRAAGASTSTINAAMATAVQRGFADRERRGQRFRYTITEAGLEYVTAPVEDREQNALRGQGGDS